jgi:hypothetical protein
MAYCAERDENHVSTVLVTIQQSISLKFHSNISNFASKQWLSMAFNYSGIILVGTMISLAIFFTILTIPLIIFSDLKALDAIKYSFQLLKTN